MADNQIIAATLAAEILNTKEISHDADGARIAVDFYQDVLRALRADAKREDEKIGQGKSYR